MASRIQINLKSIEEPFSTDLVSDLEIEWCIDIGEGNNPAYRLTFRGESNTANSAYHFLNDLIINQHLSSVSNIDTIDLLINDIQYELHGEKIKNISTTSSIKAVEVVFNLRDLSAADDLPFLKGE